ncbi:MAG: hypothetical protein HZB42_05835 [Sphingobacteriales bacterium]|nr:hypothetical protein [Sphingobacteriales bacterium]
MKIFLIFGIAAVLVSCTATAPPKEEEVKQMVELWYIQESSADGAGIWDVKEINVLSIERAKDNKKIFHTTSLVNGIHHSPALAEPRPDERFSDTLRMNLTWNGAKWVTAE